LKTFLKNEIECWNLFLEVTKKIAPYKENYEYLRHT